MDVECLPTRPYRACGGTITVAIINDAPDVAAIVECLFHAAGFQAVRWIIVGRSDGISLAIGPLAVVLVWDVSVPESASWKAFEALISRPDAGPEIILTSSNARLLAPVARLTSAAPSSFKRRMTSSWSLLSKRAARARASSVGV
jgi:hypothetical protein